MNTTERERQLLALIVLMQQELDCLRSVLSEWEHDKDCFVQWNRAEIFRHARECMEHNL